MKETAQEFYIRKEADKNFKDWTLAGLYHLLSTSVNKEIKIKIDIAIKKLEEEK